MKAREQPTKSAVIATPLALVIHQSVMVPFNTINEAPYNPRRISKEKLEGIKGNIRKNGFIDPIVLRKADNGLIGGHQRVRSVREICAEDKLPLPAKLPAIVLDISARDAKKLNIALNKLGGEFDNKKLSDLLLDIQSEQAITSEETDLMGFRAADVTALLALNAPPVIDTDPKPFAKGPTLSLMFSSEAVRDSVRATLKKRAESEKKHVGDVVFNLLGGVDSDG